MKRKNSRVLIAVLLAGLLLASVACRKDDPSKETDPLPDTIETVTTEHSTEPDTEDETEVETETETGSEEATTEAAA